jgi:hypothetical protein
MGGCVRMNLETTAQLGKRSQLASVLQLFLLGSVFCRKNCVLQCIYMNRILSIVLEKWLWMNSDVH